MMALPWSLGISIPGQAGKEAALGGWLPSSSQSESLPTKGDSVIGEKAQGVGGSQGGESDLDFFPF